MPRDENRRAALAGLAATGSLLAATAAVALVVGGVLGFGAFPSAARDAALPPLRVAPAPAGATARAPVGRRVSPRRSLRHSAREHTVRASRPHRSPPIAPQAPAYGAGPPPPTVPAPAPPDQAPSGGAPTPPAHEGGPLAPAVDAARDAGPTATGPVAPLAPAATGPVEVASATVAGAVEQADRGVAATLGTLGR
jgi:hypothetical protein